MLQPDANAVVRSGVIPQLRDADMEKEWCSTLKKLFYFRILKMVHCKIKRLAAFPSPAGLSLTKLSLGGNNLIIPAQGEFGK
jgi:hypothetical protein